MFSRKRVPAWRAVAAASLLAAAAGAGAAPVTVLPGDPSWVSPAGENTGGGSAAITGSLGISGNGSVELHGDRTRLFGLGNPYSPASNLGLLNDVLSLVFDWAIAVGSTATLHPDYTPALRLHIWDGSVRSELIWEGVYNGTYGSTTQGVVYSSGADDVFWRFVSGGPGVTFDGGSQVNLSIQDWADGANAAGAQWYSDAAYVSAISIGAGSSAGANYRAYADNVTLATAAGSTTYNFELSANNVPEPQTLALAGLALLGLAAARRRAR